MTATRYQKPLRDGTNVMSLAQTWFAHVFGPEAHCRICFDKFHVAQHLGNGVDTVRRAEHKRLAAEGEDRLKGTRYRWPEQPKNMATRHLPRFRQLRDSALATAAPWSVKEYAMCLWSYISRTWAEKGWHVWIAWRKRKGIAPVTKVAKWSRSICTASSTQSCPAYFCSPAIKPLRPVE